jgi:hypothetical protein
MVIPKPAITNGANSVLNLFLGEYSKRAFTIEEDDHCLTLYHEGAEIAEFGNHATLEEIQAACHQHWNEHYSGINYGRN